MSKCLGFKDKTSLQYGIQTGSPMVVTLGQQYNVREKPTVILYTYINRHAGTLVVYFTLTGPGRPGSSEVTS